MTGPIHIDWWNRPGWGEFLAMRGGKPTHGGFDTYTEPKATIYGTADNGTVIAKGYVGGMQWGYYVDVYYPATAFRRAYYQRDCHLNEMAGIAVGAAVTTGTALGRVGRSGNARDIYWPASQSPNGRELWHVHSEVYLTNRVDFSKRTNPLGTWGVTTAGGKGTPITDKKGVRHMYRAALKDTKRVAYFDSISFREFAEGSVDDNAWGRFVGKPGLTVTQEEWNSFETTATANGAKNRGGSGMFRAVLAGTKRVAYFDSSSFFETTDGAADDNALGRFVGKPGLTVTQAEWDSYERIAKAAGSAGPGGSTDLAPVLTAIGKIPTAPTAAENATEVIRQMKLPGN